MLVDRWCEARQALRSPWLPSTLGSSPNPQPRALTAAPLCCPHTPDSCHLGLCLAHTLHLECLASFLPGVSRKPSIPSSSVSPFPPPPPHLLNLPRDGFSCQRPHRDRLLPCGTERAPSGGWVRACTGKGPGKELGIGPWEEGPGGTVCNQTLLPLALEGSSLEAEEVS